MTRFLTTPVESLSLRQIVALVDALMTVADVLSGLQEQPRFAGGGVEHTYNQAGRELESLRQSIFHDVDVLRIQGKARRVTCQNDIDDQFDLLAGTLIGGGGEDPASAVAELARFVADAGFSLRHAKGGAA